MMGEMMEMVMVRERVGMEEVEEEVRGVRGVSVRRESISKSTNMSLWAVSSTWDQLTLVTTTPTLEREMDEEGGLSSMIL